MNLKELIDRGRYSKFSRMGDENRTKHIEIVNYIDQLSGASSINTDSWDVYEIFGKGVGNELILDKKEINRRFFIQFREDQNEVEPDRFSMEANIQTQIDDAARQRLTNMITNLQSRKADNLRQANRRMNDANSYIAEAFQCEQEARAVANRRIDVGAQMATIVAEGFWEYVELSGTKLVLRTREDVRCQHVNPNAGVDIRMNLGKYDITLDLQSMNLHGRQVEEGGKILWRMHNIAPHPHISGSGSICWGNSSNTVSRLLASCELVEVFRLLANLLCDYCDENPYTPLVSYRDVEVRIRREEQQREAEAQAQEEANQEGEASPEEGTEASTTVTFDVPPATITTNSEAFCEECEEYGHETFECEPPPYSEEDDEY